jgi:cation transport regulator ChaC
LIVDKNHTIQISTTLFWIFGEGSMIRDKCFNIRAVNKCWIHGY